MRGAGSLRGGGHGEGGFCETGLRAVTAPEEHAAAAGAARALGMRRWAPLPARRL